MARVAKIVKYNKQKKLVANKSRQSARAALKSIISDSTGKYTPEEKMTAAFKLQKRKRDESACRVTTRCEDTGRPHSVLRKFSLCFHSVRKYFRKLYLPGVRKSSW